MSSSTAGPVGAYGYRLDAGLFGRRYLHEPAADWPPLRIELRPQADGAQPSAPAGWRDALAGPGWSIRVARGGGAVSWTGPWPPRDPDSLVHPLLSVAVCAATLERGGDCFHAGAVLTPDGLVVVLAGSGGGKTTTLGWLATRCGLDVFTDDHLNVHGGVAHAGPRCLDLRPSAAVRLDLTGRSRPVRLAERHRLELAAPAVLRAPVVRTVVLEWADTSAGVRVEAVPPRDRLAILATHRTAQMTAGDLTVPLTLATLPMVRLLRPRTFDCMDEVARAVLDG
jgi:hypothetical protein